MKKMKTIFAPLCAMLLIVCAVLPAAAAPARLVDNAGILAADDSETLAALLDEVSARRNADIVIVTTDSLDGKTPQAYADDFYDENGYGQGANRDGVLFLICMGTRDWYISTTGAGIDAITDAGREYIADQFLSDLSNGYYIDAFTTFANQCDIFFEQAENGEPFDGDNMPKGDFSVGMNLLIALAIGFVIALIATGIMRGKLKTVRRQAAADSYVKPGSLNITESRDLFLYTHVDRRERPKDDDNSSSGSSTHVSSSGTTHGGGGGKF